jgi:hypothetical protein
MKRRTSVILTVIFTVCLAVWPNVALGATFSDLMPSDWGYQEVLSLTDQKIISGYPDGTFRPDAQITRAEFCKLIVKTVPRGLDPKYPAKPTFPDVDRNHWAYGYVEAVAAQGWVNGFPDGNFRSEQSITKAEVLKIMVVAAERPLQTAIPSPYLDSQPTEWWAPYLSTALGFDWIGAPDPGLVVELRKSTGVSSSKLIGYQLEPQKPATRIQTAVLLYRLRMSP